MSRAHDIPTIIGEMIKYESEWHGKDLHIITGETVELMDGRKVKDDIIYKNVSKKDLKAKIKYLLEKIK